MKKPTFLALVIAAVIACFLLRWHQVKISEFDETFRRNLAGTWSAELDNMTLTNKVMPDGSFTIQAIFRHQTRTNSYQMTGTWLVTGGSIVETVTSDTNPTAATPRSITGKILDARPREFVVRWGISPDKWTWRKIIM